MQTSSKRSGDHTSGIWGRVQYQVLYLVTQWQHLSQAIFEVHRICFKQIHNHGSCSVCIHFFVKCGWTRNLLHQLTAKFNRFFRFLCLWTGIMQSQFVRSSTVPHIQAFIKLIKDVKGWYHLYKNNLHMYEGGQSISRLGIKEPLLWVHSKFKRQTLTQHFQICWADFWIRYVIFQWEK